MKKFIIPLFGLLIAFGACTRVDRGPEGPPGPRGRDAAVLAFEYNVQPSAWTQSGNAGDPDFGFLALADFPELTPDVLELDHVAGFYIMDDGGQVPMPAIFYNNNFQTNYDYILYPGEVEFWVRESDNQTIAPTATQTYKMVIVTVAGKNTPNLKSMSLEEIEQYFHIEHYEKISIK